MVVSNSISLCCTNFGKTALRLEVVTLVTSGEDKHEVKSLLDRIVCHVQSQEPSRVTESMKTMYECTEYYTEGVSDEGEVGHHRQQRI